MKVSKSVVSIFCLCTIAILLVSCTTHRSVRQEANQYLFVTDNEKAVFNAAYDVISEVYEVYPVKEIMGNVRGYSSTTIFMLDQHTTLLRVYRASGTKNDGTTVYGYYAEVSGQGTRPIVGPQYDKRIYEGVNSKFSALFDKVSVSGIKREDYLLQMDSYRLNSAPSLRDGGAIRVIGSSSTGKSITEKLEELDALKSSGVISAAEYEKARKQVLSQF